MIHSPVVLDFFCCGGGASRGYALAGFDVLGIDLIDQPLYPFPFLRASAFGALDALLAGRSLTFMRPDGTLRTITLADVAAVVGSPPCQAHTKLRHRTGLAYDDFIDGTRDRFQATGLPWIIENVVGAPLREPVQLCGTAFGLGAIDRTGMFRELQRHRLFESNVPIDGTPCQHEHPVIGVYGHGGIGPSQRGHAATQDESREALGIDWLPQSHLAQAIPPAYTRWLGHQLREHLSR